MVKPYNNDSVQLLCRPRQAMRMLDCGANTLYDLINRGELQSFREGGARKIVVASIEAYVRRKLEKNAE